MGADVMGNDRRRLPDSELAVMQAVWRCEAPAARAQIEAQLTLERALASTTVLTFLTRLCEKGFLAVERQGKSNVYTPLVSEREYLAGESRDVLDRLFGSSLTAFATSLMDSGVSREEIEELRRLLEEGKL